MNILFVYNVDWFFKSHRFAFAKKLQILGHKISLVSNSEDNSIESFLSLNNINFWHVICFVRVFSMKLANYKGFQCEKDKLNNNTMGYGGQR